jgi:sugar-specific transcriptional regulator TrmB
MAKSTAALMSARRRRCILAHTLPIVLCAGTLAAPATARAGPPPDSPDNPVSEWFACSSSPQGGCAEVLVRAIREAQQKIVVETADLGPRAVAHALCSDIRRGIDVEIVRTPACAVQGANQSSQPRLTQCDPNYRIDIPQTMVIDREVVVGSFFGPPPASAAPRAIDHLFMDMNRISALAYSESLERQSHPLEAQRCRWLQ